MSNYFDIEERGYRIVAEKADRRGNSTVTVSRGDEEVRRFQWPAYKVWNLAAHAGDIVDGLDYGLRIAGSTGFGGNVYAGRPATEGEEGE